MCSGGGGSMPKPVTRAEMEAATDNRFENPNSGVSAPSWKPDEVKKEKAEIAAEEAAAKAAAARVSSTEVVPRSSGRMGVAKRNKLNAARKAKKANRTAPSGQDKGAMRSDIELKENINEVGLSPLGYKIYEFNYKGDNTRYRGAMAQDVITKLPQAIGVRDGYFTVAYNMIDITMEVI